MDLSYNAIISHLYVGSKDAFTEDLHFHLIVNCTVNIPFPIFPPIEKKMRIPIDDTEQDDVKMLEMMLYTNVLEKIYKHVCNKQNVLIYSEYGNQRACALASCFLIRYMRITPKQAVRFIVDKRKSAFKEENRFANTIDFYYRYLHFEQNGEEKENQKIDISKKQKLIPKIQSYET
jgi:hypothetical protein